jgi:hypothetical protein
VQVREADYARPETLGPALGGVNRLLRVSSSEAGAQAELPERTKSGHINANTMNPRLI